MHGRFQECTPDACNQWFGDSFSCHNLIKRPFKWCQTKFTFGITNIGLIDLDLIAHGPRPKNDKINYNPHQILDLNTYHER